MSGPLTKVESRPVPAAHPARRLWTSIAALVAGVALLIWAGTEWHARMASAQIRSLALLPFQDLTQPNEAWFAPSFTGEIIDSLSRAAGLHVVGRASALKMTADAAKQLGVAATISGSIAQTGDRLHIALEMTRIADGYHLWSATFDRPADNPHVAIEDIAAAIASRLRVGMPAPAARRHWPTPEAYTAYLEGRYRFDLAKPEELNRAQELLEQSTAADPNFVPAWAWLSIVREYRVASGMVRPNRAMPGSRDAAERAVALDPESGVAHLALGIVKLQYDWDWSAAREQFDRALQAMPESAFVRAWSGRWFHSQGRLNESISESQRALDLDPLSAAVASDLAAEYVSLNQPAKALPFAQKAAGLAPDDPSTQASLANVLWLAGNQDQARQIVERLRTSGAAAKLPPSQLARLEARMGDPQDARQLLDAAEDLPDDELLPAVEYAGLAGVLEDWDRLFSWTEEAYGERDVELPYWPVSPLVPKSDPRFDALLAQMNLPAPEAH